MKVRSFTTTLGTVVAIVLLAPSAGAQEVPCPGGPCVKRQRRGTHFLAEINGGTSISGKPGLSVGGLLGVGGKLRGFPLRFYLVGEFSYATGGQEGTLASPSLAFREERSYRDLAAGLRIYVPIWGPLRLFVDGMGGGSYVSASFDREGLSPLAASDWYGLGLVATGLQVRLFHHMSVGVRAKLVFTRDGLAEMREMMGVDTAMRSSVTAGLTWHF